jgi:hypothetical protein
MTTTYPDIAEIIARKERGRAQQASLSFEEKLAILDRLRETDETLGAAMREDTSVRCARENP